MDKKDFRALLRSWKKFGGIGRIEEIIEDAGLGGKDTQSAEEIAEGVSLFFLFPFLFDFHRFCKNAGRPQNMQLTKRRKSP